MIISTASPDLIIHEMKNEFERSEQKKRVTRAKDERNRGRDKKSILREMWAQWTASQAIEMYVMRCEMRVYVVFTSKSCVAVFQLSE